jgi:hypothetical protein
MAQAVSPCGESDGVQRFRATELGIRNCFIAGHWPIGQQKRSRLEARTGFESSGKTGLSSYRKKQGKPVK